MGRFRRGGRLPRAAGSRTWARGQLKYDGFPVLWSPKRTEKMLQFRPKYDPKTAKNKWSPKKKKVFELNMLISPCHFDGPSLKPMGPLLGSLKPTKPMGPLNSMGPGVIVLPCPPLSAALVVPPNYVNIFVS